MKLYLEQLNAVGLKKEAVKCLGVVKGDEILVQVAAKYNTGNVSQFSCRLFPLCILTTCHPSLLLNSAATTTTVLQCTTTCSVVQKSNFIQSRKLI